MPADLQRLARQFTNFAETGTSGDSPLYEHLSRRIANDTGLLALAGEKLPSQPPPNILFAAVHDLLIGGAAHPLRNFYPNLTAQPDTGDPFPAFRDFCLSRRAELLRLIRTRRTQTNEVNRCALLLPAFTAAANRLGGGRVALIELGPSAGLNLNWPHYGYNYGEDRVFRGTAPLEVGASLRGSRLPPLPRVIPPFEIVSNRGVELLPINLSDPENVRWLKALVWPEHTARFELLSRAIEFARQRPPEVLAGDALTRLRGWSPSCTTLSSPTSSRRKSGWRCLSSWRRRAVPARCTGSRLSGCPRRGR
jgi:hypothetical protein